MPRSSVRTGHVIDRMCDALKVCRAGWISTKDAAEAMGYKKADYMRKLLNVMAAHGVLETRKVKSAFHVHGPYSMEYRVAKEWRSE